MRGEKSSVSLWEFNTLKILIVKGKEQSAKNRKNKMHTRIDHILLTLEQRRKGIIINHKRNQTYKGEMQDEEKLSFANYINTKLYWGIDLSISTVFANTICKR